MLVAAIASVVILAVILAVALVRAAMRGPEQIAEPDTLVSLTQVESPSGKPFFPDNETALRLAGELEGAPPAGDAASTGNGTFETVTPPRPPESP